MFKVGDKFVRTKDGDYKNKYNVVGYIGTVIRVFPDSVMCDKGRGHRFDCIRKMELEDLLAAAESDVKSLREQIKQRDARPPEVDDTVTYGSAFYGFKVMAVDGSMVWLKIISAVSGRPTYITKDYKTTPNFKVVKRASK